MIDRYTIVPNWKRVGLPTEFIILAETQNEEQLFEIEKMHVVMADEYASSTGDIVVTPMVSGCIILQDIYYCYGDKQMGVIIGRATSDQDKPAIKKLKEIFHIEKSGSHPLWIIIPARIAIAAL